MATRSRASRRRRVRDCGTETYLGEPGFARLWQAARSAFERNGGLGGQALVSGLSAEEATALNGLLRRRRPLRAGGQLNARPLSALDATLREFACPLEQWLDRARGRSCEPARTARAGRAARARPVGRARIRGCGGRHPARCRCRGSAGQRAAEAPRSRLELQLGRQAIDVLETILGSRGGIVDLAVLAARRCGDAKALNDGRPLATVVLRGLGLLAVEPMPTTGAERRDLWERFGVVCDPLSSHVLFLNLPVANEPGIAAAIAAHRDAGEPMRLTLRALRRVPLQFAASLDHPRLREPDCRQRGGRGVRLFVRASRLRGWTSRRRGQRLLAQAAAAGCALCYHGDFDWPGVAMAADAMRRYGATPWRLTAADYEAALTAGAPARRLAGAPAPTPWDRSLEATMRAAGLVVEEEAMIAVLLSDLAP